MNTIFLYITTSLVGVSTVLNILYLADGVSEIWFRLGFVAAVFSSVILNFLNLVKTRRKNKNKSNANENENKTRNTSSAKMALFWFFLLILVWVISCFAALFY